MPLNTTKSSKTFEGNGVTLVFDCDFRIFAASDVTAFYVDPSSGTVTPLALNTDYSITGANNDGGFQLTTVVAVPVGQNMVVRRVIPYTQPTSFTNQSRFFPTLHQDMADRLAMQIQQLGEQAGRALTYPAGVVTGFSGELPYPLPGNVLGWNGSGTAIVNAGSVLGTALGFQQSGVGSVLRYAQDKMREQASVKDFGAAGDGVAEDGAKIATAIAAKNGLTFPSGTYKNSATALTVPFTKAVVFAPDAAVANSGAGSFTAAGPAVKYGYNPSGMTSWTSAGTANYEGIAVDFGNYGTRSFGSSGLVIGVTGAVNVPANSTLYAHACGVAGYAKSASPTTAGVALYGEGSSQADRALVWGLNTRSLDNGHYVPVMWGAEFDLNVDNINTIPLGVEVTGGASVEPAISIGFKVSPLNPFNATKVRWQRAFMSDDGAAKIGLEIGSVQTAANAAAQDVTIYYRGTSNTRLLAFSLTTSGVGNTTLAGGLTGATGSGPGIFDITGNPAGPAPVRINGGNLAFFGAFPTSRPVVPGATATDLATTAALCNYMRAAGVALGLWSNS